MTWVNAVVQGLLLGGLYALLASGLSLMFGVMRLVNLAHGALAVVAAYLALTVVDATGVSPLLTLVAVVPVMALLGYALQRGVLNRAMRAGPLAPLLATFGLAVVVESALLEGFSADTQSLAVPGLDTASLRLTDGLAIGAFPTLVFVAGIAAVVGLQLFLFRTGAGRRMRAVSQDGEAARLMGIDDRRVYATATAIALALVGVAGVLLAVRSTFTPGSGGLTLLFAFEAVVIGGLGSLWGTLAGGMVLGVAQLLGAAVEPAYGVLTGHVVFLIVLAVRPQGLFPSKAGAT